MKGIIDHYIISIDKMEKEIRKKLKKDQEILKAEIQEDKTLFEEINKVCAML